MRSFDAQRPRSAPDSFRGLTLAGQPVERSFKGLTLVVAIKPLCDGCRAFGESSLEEFADLDVLLVATQDQQDDEWRDIQHEIVLAPELLTQLDVRWPPFYVLIDANTNMVLAEGVVFGPSQVAEEIRSYLTP